MPAAPMLTFRSSDPGSRQTMTAEADGTLPEVELVMDDAVVCLDVTQVAALTAMLVGWLSARAS